MSGRNSRALLLVALLCGVLGACVSTGENGRKVSNKDAARANMQLGVAYMQKGQLQLAKDKLERAEKQDPGNYEVHWAMASLSEHLNQPAEAERQYQSALKLAPGNSEIANTYAVFLCKSGKVDRALPLFDGVIRDPLYRTPWAAAANAAVCLRADKRNADAIPYLQRALSLRPDFVTAVVEMSDLQLALGKPDQAQATVDNFLSIGRKSPDVLLVGVRAALAQGNRSAADNYARLLRRDFPNSPPTQALPQLLGGGKSP
jgi:type IV pilus assembly protein PilF